MKRNKQRLFEVMSKVDSSFKINENLEEARPSGVNRNYTHFAVLKNNYKIVNGWDYRGYDSEELKSEKNHYFFYDIKDMQIDPKLVNIVTTKHLQKKGINPFDFANWNTDQNIFNESKVQNNDTYFPSLSQALDAIREKAALKGYTVDEDDIWNNYGTGGINYGETKRATIGLLKDGVPAKNRSMTIAIYRMDSGMYELVSYINK